MAANQDLAEMVVGRAVSFKTAKEPANPQETVLSIMILLLKKTVVFQLLRTF